MPTVEHPEGAGPTRTQIKSDLTAFYDARAEVRADSTLTPDRTLAREIFGDVLAAHDMRVVVDLGAGTGQDAAAFISRGVRVIALDLSHEHCRWAGRRGAMSAVADLYQLPLRSRSVPALWSVSTYQHVPGRDVLAVIGETGRTLRSGAPAMIGVWAGQPVEETRIDGELRRFYSIRSPEQWLAQFEAVVGVERWWIDEESGHGPYLWLLARGR